MKFPLHAPAWLGAAQLPLQVAVLTYVGAGGLAGAAIVGGVMLSPVGEAVQEAVAPARQFVESVVPMNVPSFFPSDPVQAIARRPVGKAPLAGSAAPTAVPTPLAVDDVVILEDVAEPTPSPSVHVIAPQRSAPATQPVVQLAPGQADQPEIGLPAQGGFAPIGPAVVAEPPIAAFERSAPVMPGRPAAAVVVEVRTNSRSEGAADAQARAPVAPASPRVAIGNANADTLHVATVASPTTIVVRTTSGRTSEAPPTSTAVPTPSPALPAPAAAPTVAPTAVEREEEPTRAPTAVPPTQAPTRAPTQAATQEAKKTSVPTEEPKKAAVPTREPTKAPQRPVKATPAPARAAPTATASKEKEKAKEKRPTPAPTPSRRDRDDHGGQNSNNNSNSGNNESSKGHEGG